MERGGSSKPRDDADQEGTPPGATAEATSDEAVPGRSRGRRLLAYVGWFTTWLGALVTVYETLQRLGLL